MDKKFSILFMIIGIMMTLYGCTVSKDQLSLSDYHVVFFGDSITQNFEDQSKSYPDIVKELTGIEMINMSFGGTALSIHPNKSFDAFSFHSLADVIVSGKLDSQRNVLEDPDLPDYFDEKLNEFEKIDWTEIDVIAMMYGANDWGNPLENKNNLYDTASFMGAGRYSIEKILRKYPHIQFFLLPSPYRFWPDYNNVDSNSSVNIHGNSPYQFSDAMNELAKEFNFPSADTYRSLGINEWNRNLYFKNTDGTHPNELGTKLIAEKVAKSLLINF